MTHQRGGLMYNGKSDSKTSRPRTSFRMTAASAVAGDSSSGPDRPVTTCGFSRKRPDSVLDTHFNARGAPSKLSLAVSATKTESTEKKLDLAIELFTRKRYRQAYPLFDELALAKNICAMYHKAVMTFDGLGTIESTREGLLGLRRVFEQSSRESADPEYRHLACYQLGLAYTQGTGARQDHREAVRWWTKAANEIKFEPNSSTPIENQLITSAGTKCQIMLAQYYSQPQSLNLEKSYLWYKEAALNGSVESMLQVGLMAWYEMGCSSQSDTDQRRDQIIMNFLGQAADAGNVCASGNLAMFCLEEQHQEQAFQLASRVVANVNRMENVTTLGAAVAAIAVSPDNDNSEEAITKSIAMSYFVLAHLHNVGAVASLDKEKATEFYEVACSIDIYLVQALTSLLENQQKLQ